MSRGIYTLANDNTLDWVYGLLGSMNRVGCSLPLWIIPYDSKTRKIRRFVSRSTNVFLHKCAYEPELIAIGEYISGKRYSSRMFLKLEAFWGPLDKFIYLDSDICLGADPAHWLEAFSRFDDSSVIMTDPSLDYIFKEPTKSLFRAIGRPACNAGFFIGKRGIINLADIDLVSDSLDASLLESFFPEYGDQSFLNYLFYHLNIHVQLLSTIQPALTDATWAPQPAFPRGDGSLSSDQPLVSENSQIPSVAGLPFLHWAGLQMGPDMANLPLFISDYIRSAPPLQSLALLCTFLSKKPYAFIRAIRSSCLPLLKLFLISCAKEMNFR